MKNRQQSPLVQQEHILQDVTFPCNQWAQSSPCAASWSSCGGWYGNMQPRQGKGMITAPETTSRCWRYRATRSEQPTQATALLTTCF